MQRDITWLELQIWKGNMNIIINEIMQTTVLVWSADHPSKRSKYFVRRKRGYTIYLNMQRKLAFRLRGSDHPYLPQCILFQECQDKMKLLEISLFRNIAANTPKAEEYKTILLHFIFQKNISLIHGTGQLSVGEASTHQTFLSLVREDKVGVAIWSITFGYVTIMALG